MSLDCLKGKKKICKSQAPCLCSSKRIRIEMELPFLIFCVSKTAFRQLLSNRKQLSRELLVTLEASNLISGDSVDIFSSFNSPDEKETLLQGREEKDTGISCKCLLIFPRRLDINTHLLQHGNMDSWGFSLFIESLTTQPLTILGLTM